MEDGYEDGEKSGIGVRDVKFTKNQFKNLNLKKRESLRRRLSSSLVGCQMRKY